MRILIILALLLGSIRSAFAQDLRYIDTIIIHHSDSSDVSADTIRQWHKARGWEDIGYHFIIRTSGSIETGRPIEKAGAHAKGRNIHSIGICLTGYDSFTPKQSVSLENLIRYLIKKYPILSLERHHERCPGPGINVEALYEKYLGKFPQLSEFHSSAHR